jgi:hypothetical protein
VRKDERIYSLLKICGLQVKLIATDGTSNPEDLYAEVVSQGVFTLEELEEMRKSGRIDLEYPSEISSDEE